MRFSVVLIALMIQLFGQAPAWFGTLSSSADFEIIGYGEGITLDEAKSNAKSDIAKSIRSHIDSTFSTHTSVNNSAVNHTAQSSIRETSNLTITDAQLKKSEQNNGRFYVALRYENLPLSTKLAKRGGQALCGKPNAYLAQTPTLLNLSSELNCSVSVDITRENEGWYLGRGEHRNSMNNADFRALMIETSMGTLRIKSNRTLINEEETYTLNLEGLPAMGYLSLFDVYDDGRVVLMENNLNLATKSKKEFLYPDDIRNDFELSGGVSEAGNDALDLYVVLVSKEPLKLSNFIPMGQRIEKGERAFAVDRLLTLMHNNSFATTVVTTKAVVLKK